MASTRLKRWLFLVVLVAASYEIRIALEQALNPTHPVEDDPELSRRTTTTRRSSSNGSHRADINRIAGDRYDALRRLLQGINLQYYMYNDSELVRKDINDWLLNAGNSNKLLRKRYLVDALVELDILDTLANHPLRTFDPKEARVFVVPIAMAAHLMWDQQASLSQAFHFLLGHKLFQQWRGHRHLVVSLAQQPFDYLSTGSVKSYGLDKRLYRRLENITVARESDPFAIVHMAKHGVAKHHDYAHLFRVKAPTTLHTFSVGLLVGQQELLLRYREATYEKFSTAKYFIFYHTRRGKSGYNSTIYRHLCLEQSIIQRLPDKSSIGLGILKPVIWAKQFRESKFCLVIRGDTPHSHSLMRAIKVGCIPVVISDYYDRYAPTFKSTLNMQDYAIILEEQSFLHDPTKTLLSLATLSEEEIRDKLQALRFAQQVILMDHPESLFVQAMLREADLEMKTAREESLETVWRQTSEASLGWQAF